MRVKKARKIAKLVAPFCELEGARILEIGCGSGGIAAWFAQTVDRAEVVATDLEDLRTTTKGYEFHLSEGVELCFAKSSFDFVISNHVIEHVGEEAAQRKHIEEIARVLKPGGWAYLATPNRWRLVEGHYGLPFLSWLPARIANAYVKLTGRGSWYDVVPLSASQLAEMFVIAGIQAHSLTRQAIQAAAEIEPDRIAHRLASIASGWLPNAAFRLVPTLIYALEHESARA